MALSDTTGVRDSVLPILRAKGLLTDEQEKIIVDAFENAQGAWHSNHNEPPSGPTVLCIMALVEHIERLEASIGRYGMGLDDELLRRWQQRQKET